MPHAGRFFVSECYILFMFLFFCISLKFDVCDSADPSVAPCMLTFFLTISSSLCMSQIYWYKFILKMFCLSCILPMELLPVCSLTTGCSGLFGCTLYSAHPYSVCIPFQTHILSPGASSLPNADISTQEVLDFCVGTS